jgi:hypothetical protein
LSPTLFNLYAERIVREAQLDEVEESVRIGGRLLNNLRYADDTTLAASTSNGLQNLIGKVKTASEKAGLFLNVKKTKVMTTAQLDSFKAADETLEVVKSFSFLGSTVTDDGNCGTEIARRIALGKVAMSGLNKIWKDRSISVSTKVRLVKALVFPIMTYGCETWTTKKREQEKIRAAEYWCWRKMLRIPWTAKRTNASIAKEVGEPVSLTSVIAKMKLSYFGHVMRANSLEKSVMTGMGEGKRGRGRPRTRWIDEIKQLMGLTMEQLKEAVKDRTRWRQMIIDVTKGRLRPDGTR